jgi:hypothetical protein
VLPSIQTRPPPAALEQDDGGGIGRRRLGRFDEELAQVYERVAVRVEVMNARAVAGVVGFAADDERRVGVSGVVVGIGRFAEAVADPGFRRVSTLEMWLS